MGFTLKSPISLAHSISLEPFLFPLIIRISVGHVISFHPMPNLWFKLHVGHIDCSIRKLI